MCLVQLAAILHACPNTPTPVETICHESGNMPVYEWPFVAEHLNRNK